MDGAFFLCGFPMEREERETFFGCWISKGIFLELSYYFLIFLTFFSLFHYFLYLLPIFLHDFSQKWGGRGVFIGEWGKWNASISVIGYTSASIPLLPPHQPFSSFSNFCLDLHAAVWRAFQAPFSSTFICIESFVCLVSNSPSLAWFGATVGRWHKSKKILWHFFLEKFISSNPK